MFHYIVTRRYATISNRNVFRKGEIAYFSQAPDAISVHQMPRQLAVLKDCAMRFVARLSHLIGQPLCAYLPAIGLHTLMAIVLSLQTEIGTLMNCKIVFRLSFFTTTMFKTTFC